MPKLYTTRITSISDKTIRKDTNYINVMTWHPRTSPHGSYYYELSPYYLKTDGASPNYIIPHNAIFENFWQGSKLYKVVSDQTIYRHYSLRSPRYIDWQYTTLIGTEKHFSGGCITDNYFRWRTSLFECKRPIRYPQKYSTPLFSVAFDNEGNEHRMGYIEARKKLYVAEYLRLIKNLPIVETLHEMFAEQDLYIAEIDVPHNQLITVELLERLLENPDKPFGHGLCVAWLLLDPTIYDKEW